MKALFKTTDCLSLKKLLAYHQGELQASAIRHVEEHLIDCQLCHGALEGIIASSAPITDIKKIRSLRFAALTIGFRPARIAALLAIGFIITAAILFWPKSGSANLYADFYHPPSITRVQLRSTLQSPTQAGLQPALIAFQQEDFKSAISQLEQHLQRFPDDPEGYFWAGITQLEIGNINAAIKHLQDAKNQEKRQNGKVDWYLALAYLKKGENAKALGAINDLESAGLTTDQEQVKRLKRKLERLLQ